jgi:1,4-alpha-glucan branching enzyme
MKKALLAAIAVALTASPLAAKDAPIPARYQPKRQVQVKNPDWAKDAVIYQINTRQFTAEGTFAAAQKQLPRLKAMGVDIIWLMPIQPIGEKNRKGGLGSPYSVKDYKAVNPEFGTKADLKAFVDAAHAQGMKVILDWVANHSAWDNHLVKDHPDWYIRDWKGDFHPTPWLDWSDIIDFDFSKPGLRQYMTGALTYWVREVGIDGYRADVAGYIPLDFWENARAEMDAIKPVFMLAEWQTRDLHGKAFDASYAWDWYNSLHDIAQGKGNATAMYGFYSGHESSWPHEAIRMNFTENHDKNAWEATQYEAFGDGLEAAIALSFIAEGIPMIHNGQEACNKKRLEFFEKDAINWAQGKDCELEALFTKLAAFKSANPALWNGRWGATMAKVDNSAPEQLFSFIRNGKGNSVFAAFNLSAKPVTAKLSDAHAKGEYKSFADGSAVTLDAGSEIKLEPWGWVVLSR